MPYSCDARAIRPYRKGIDPMTPEQIERFAERKMDALDRRFLKGELTQTEYDVCVTALNRDCNDMYRKNSGIRS